MAHHNLFITQFIGLRMSERIMYIIHITTNNTNSNIILNIILLKIYVITFLLPLRYTCLGITYPHPYYPQRSYTLPAELTRHSSLHLFPGSVSYPQFPLLTGCRLSYS